MRKILLLLFASATILISGCNKYLDVKPKGYTIPEFFDDYQRLLNNSTLYATSSAYPNFLTDDVQSGLPRDANMASDFNSYALFKRNLYTFRPGAIFEDADSDSFYEPSYKRIYVYNTVINNIENTPDGTESAKKRLKAEAQVGRAFEYLTLVNAYAEHYDPATASTALGVPMVLTEDINSSYTRVTVADVYVQIKADLEEALPNLVLNVPYSFQPSKAVGYSLLSRMYLYMGNYEEALKNANEALKITNALTDHSLYTTKKSTWGRVHLIGDLNGRFPDVETSKENVWSRRGASTGGDIFTEVYASEDLLTVYKTNLAAGAIDQRLALFFPSDQAEFGGTIAVFPGRSIWGAYVNFNKGIGTPELYLTAAECEARVGSKDKALQHLNTLRDTRIIGNTPLVATSNEDALKMALEERRRELPNNGITRLVDLKRLNKDIRFQKTVTHINEGETYTLPPNDKRYILPIPPKVLAMNPSIPVYDR